MNLTLEKELIKKEIDLIDDPAVIRAIKNLLAEEPDQPITVVNDSPITDIEMALPIGRTPTPAQLKDWINSISDDEQNLTIKEALVVSLSELQKSKNAQLKK